MIGFLELLGELAGLNDVGALHRPDLVAQQPSQQAHLEVRLLLVGERVEELVREDRQLRSLDAGELVDVDDLVGRHSLVDELADGRIDLDRTRAAATGVGVLDLQDRRTYVGEQSGVVSDRRCLVTRPSTARTPSRARALGRGTAPCGPGRP